MDIHVRVLEYRRSFGRDRYLVEPVNGSGTAIVELPQEDITK